MVFQERFPRHRLEERQLKTALDAARTLLTAQKTVSFTYLHGAALHLLRGEQDLPPHDLDLAIYLNGGDFLGIALDLQLDFDRLTGFIPELLDVHSLNDAPFPAAIKILEQGALLFCRDDTRHADFLEKFSNSRPHMADLLEASHG